MSSYRHGEFVKCDCDCYSFGRGFRSQGLLVGWYEHGELIPTVRALPLKNQTRQNPPLLRLHCVFFCFAILGYSMDWIMRWVPFTAIQLFEPISPGCKFYILALMGVEYELY